MEWKIIVRTPKSLESVSNKLRQNQIKILSLMNGKLRAEKFIRQGCSIEHIPNITIADWNNNVTPNSELNIYLHPFIIVNIHSFGRKSLCLVGWCLSHRLSGYQNLRSYHYCLSTNRSSQQRWEKLQNFE